MKFFLLSYFLFTCSICFGQRKQVTVLESENKTALPYVYIDFLNGKGTLTNSKGTGTLPANVTEIEIIHLGYKTVKQKTAAIKDVILLEPEALSMEEVVIAGKKKKHIRIFPKRSLNNLLPHNVGTGNPINFNNAVGIFIPNEEKVTATITKIVLYPTDYKVMDLSTGTSTNQKDAKYSPFKVNLYSVHPKIGIPLEPLLKDDITVQLQQGEKQLIIELPAEIQVPFYEEGVFIVISSFDKAYYEKAGTTVKTAPAFLRIGTGRQSKFKMYTKNSYRDIWERDSWYWKNNSVYYAGLEVVQEQLYH